MSSIQDQIAAAWKKYSESSSVMKNRENFEAGYLAGLRSLFVEVKPEDLVKNERYHVAFIENGNLVWRKNVMVSLSRPHLLCWSGSKGWDWEYAERSTAVRAFKMATTILPSPSDLFTEGVPR